MTDDVLAELANRGHPGVRASYEFTRRAIGEGSDTASELGRRLSVTKQAAAQAITVLEQLGYVDREADPGGRAPRAPAGDTAGARDDDARRGSLDEVRDRWAAQIGARELDALQARLAQLTARRSLTADDLL
jgi:DNA-binding MarR family transcriptional regulator